MATDATGTPTSPDNIPTFNTAVDAPSGKGFNAAMAAIQTALSARVSAPSGIATGEVPVWNGTTWARSTTTRISASSLAASPAITTFLRGDSTWQKGGVNLLYDSLDAGVTFPTTSITTPALDQSFSHLMILWNGKVNTTSQDNMLMRMNGDSGTNYAWQDVSGSGASAAAGGANAVTSMVVGQLSQNNGFNAGGVIFIPQYSFGTYAPVTSMCWSQVNATPTFQLILIGAIWKSAVAISTLTFLTQGGTGFNTGRWSIYGIPG